MLLENSDLGRCIENSQEAKLVIHRNSRILFFFADKFQDFRFGRFFSHTYIDWYLAAIFPEAPSFYQGQFLSWFRLVTGSLCQVEDPHISTGEIFFIVGA